MTLQGEDLGAWVQAQRLGWEQLLPAQQWMLENMLHLGPAAPEERSQAPRTQADNWAANLTAEAGRIGLGEDSSTARGVPSRRG